MNIVLIEDEAIAMRMLRKVILSVYNSAVIVAELESVTDALKWFAANRSTVVDVIFSDIQLIDGLSFEIFESLQLNFPVIFTTAYNEYAIRAFKVNGIDYLLKPVQEKEVEAALGKLKQTKSLFSQQQMFEIQLMMQQFHPAPVQLNPTFLAFQKEKIIPVKCENVAWLNTQNQILTAVMVNSQKMHLEETMDNIEKRLPKAEFFRVNRQYIVSRKAILEAEFYFNNRLSVKLNPPAAETVIISRERVFNFRNWLQGLL
ncbi:MAG: response regulator transcription factor [Paludibacter sp.]|nr:response regulator transcription factor [Paludibacter sp.]